MVVSVLCQVQTQTAASRWNENSVSLLSAYLGSALQGLGFTQSKHFCDFGTYLLMGVRWCICIVLATARILFLALSSFVTPCLNIQKCDALVFISTSLMVWFQPDEYWWRNGERKRGCNYLRCSSRSTSPTLTAAASRHHFSAWRGFLWGSICMLFFNPWCMISFLVEISFGCTDLLGTLALVQCVLVWVQWKGCMGKLSPSPGWSWEQKQRQKKKLHGQVQRQVQDGVLQALCGRTHVVAPLPTFPPLSQGKKEGNKDRTAMLFAAKIERLLCEGRLSQGYSWGFFWWGTPCLLC